METLAVPPARLYEQPLSGGTKPHSPGVPERVGKALVGWIHEPEVRQLYQAENVTSPDDVEDFVEECRAKRAIRPQIPGAPSAMPAIGNLPPSLTSEVEALQRTEQFRTAYGPFGAVFVMVPLADLITPQWWADTEYVDFLAASPPDDDDVEGLFRFSFSTGQLAQPMQLGLNGAAFASSRGDLGVPSPLRVADYSPDKVTFQFDVTPRPNWVWLAASGDIANRLLILNGVHHLLALLKAGRTHAICLLRPAQSVVELGLNPQAPGIFKMPMLTAARPPLLSDYLDDVQAAAIGARLRQRFLRLAVNSEAGEIPSVQQ